MDHHEEALANCFRQEFDLPPEATAWLLDLWRVIQVFDDVADDDTVGRPDLDCAIFAALVGMPANAFFRANSSSLLPVVATMIFKWQGSDVAERNGLIDARSFVWRAGYYDVVMLTIHLCHGPEMAAKTAIGVMHLYGEIYEDYKAEFSDA